MRSRAASLVGREAEITRLQFAALAELRDFDASGEALVLGYQSTVAWLKAELRLSGTEAARRVRLARALDTLTDTAKAGEAGEISVAHAVHLARGVERLTEAVGPEVAAAAEAPLLDLARLVDPDALRREVQAKTQAIAPEAALVDEESRHERRRLSISDTFDGMVAVDGFLDPESGAIIRTALAPLLLPCAPDDDRTTPQRRADALVDICRRVLNAGSLPRLAGQRPQVLVTVDVETLAGRMNWAGPVTRETALRIACDAGITRILTDAKSEPLDVGRTRRAFTNAQRKALLIKYGGCATLGCTVPPEYCEIHHTTPWYLGGQTNLDDGEPQCLFHHHKIHANDPFVPMRN